MSNINQYLAAVERLDNFLANYERAGGLHREEIYSIHSIPDGEPGEIRVSDLKTLLAEIQRLTDSEDSRVVLLEAERDKLRSQLAELNNAINWHTSCLNCSSLMDTNYAQYCELERVKPVLDALGRWRDTTEHAATEALAYAYDAFVAGPGGCAGHTRKPSAAVRAEVPPGQRFPSADELRPHMGLWVSVVAGEVINSADSFGAALAWLQDTGRTAHSTFYVPAEGLSSTDTTATGDQQ